MARHTDTIIFVGAPWCGYCHSAVVQFLEAADGLGGKAFVLEVSGKELSRLADEIGITSFPSVIKSDRDGNRSVYSGERTVAAFREYLTDEKKTTDTVRESSTVAPTATGNDAQVDLNPAASPPTETSTEALAPSVDASPPPCSDAPSGLASVPVAQNTTSAQFEILVNVRQIS